MSSKLAPRIRIAAAAGFRTFVCATAALLLGGCDWGILTPAGRVARAERLILLNSLAIMLAIVVPTIAVALWFAWWYRASNRKARYRPRWSYSGSLELIVWSIPTLVILFLGGVIWIGSHQLDPSSPLPSKDRPLEVQVIALDWKWLFIYPDERVASVNELAIPAGAPVHFSLTSASVMNAFFVPKLGSMIYTMNRMVTQLHLEADGPGEYYGESTMFSGAGFSDMHFTVNAMTQESFAQWIERARASGPALDRAGYESLQRPSRNVSPFTYRAVDADLFDAVVRQELPPADGPNTGRLAGETAQGAH